MIEKRIMGHMNTNYPYVEASEATVIMDTETGEVINYCEKDGCEWYSPSKDDCFYPEIESAKLALDSYRNQLISKMDDVMRYLCIMNSWYNNLDKDSKIQFSEKDYLPYDNQTDPRSQNRLLGRYNREVKKNNNLRRIIRTGFININANNIRFDDINRIRWGKIKVEIVLKNGVSIRTCNEDEFDLIEDLFGINDSGYAYQDLNDKENNDDNDEE